MPTHLTLQAKYQREIVPALMQQFGYANRLAVPRTRDFRGLKQSMVDRSGNLTIGFREHVAFPEIKSDEVERLYGLEAVIDTTAKGHDEGLAIFKHLGFPFRSR